MRALVDTSFWIDYAQGSLSPKERALIEMLWQENACILHQFVWLELIVGFRSPKEQQTLRDYRATAIWKSLEEADALRAESFTPLLRKKGISLSASDLLVLAAADRAKAKLIHHDSDFVPVLALPEFAHLRIEIDGL